ncbi:SIMPL domain-containing protein [Flavobacterium sp. MXW15]|uniref:SIMPL domain-containing protein n=1 Tax=Xanthomonas chitinilytica TaxID=2989819 RepID=A0ABT3JXK4_9XANT|nr:SIMPL domain-containing protein [Xanthomonas sp. H13-6]MCW4455694.1 SIMPL domain-containing protein [Flavobacterium sp. MXW15]MCW4472910.1 SIMPL domain-containing protein [Xanthomonas sp. H13-6]
MKSIIAAAVLSLAALGAQAQSISGQPFIAVHGTAKAEVVPDIFPLEITLSETSKDAARTQALIEGLARQIIELTQAMEMADRDVTLSNLDVSPEYRYNDKDDTETFLGNTYQRQIKLRFHTLADLQKMISSLPQVRQVRLNTGSFATSQADELRRQLLTQAVEDARKTADIMAAAVGRRIGTVHNISNQGFNVRYVTSDEYSRQSLDRVMVTGSKIGAPVALREGSIQLDQNVYIIYTLVD